VGVDVDTRPKRELSSDERRRVEAGLAEGHWPGTFGHLTPHGLRLVFVFRGPMADAHLARQAMAGAAELVTRALAAMSLDEGYAVDDSCIDLARLFFAPNATVLRYSRSAWCLRIGHGPTYFDARDLAANAPRRKRRGRVLQRRPRADAHEHTAFAAAAARWCDDHRSLADDWPMHPGQCPACEHDGCFQQFDDRGATDDRPKWRCFSSNHGADSRRAWVSKGVGYRAGNAWVGDALDLAAFARRQTPTALLRRAGYLGPVAEVLSSLRGLLDEGQVRDGQTIGELRALVGAASAKAVGLALRKLCVGLRRRRIGGRLVTVVVLGGDGGNGGDGDAEGRGGGDADCDRDDPVDGDGGGHRDRRRGGGRVSRSDST
jgi:hypothetical protein